MRRTSEKKVSDIPASGRWQRCSHGQGPKSGRDKVSQVVQSPAGLPSKTKNYHGPKLARQKPDEKYVQRNLEVSGRLDKWQNGSEIWEKSLYEK